MARKPSDTRVSLAAASQTWVASALACGHSNSVAAAGCSGGRYWQSRCRKPPAGTEYGYREARIGQRLLRQVLTHQQVAQALVDEQVRLRERT